MKHIELTIAGMSCNHCVMAVKKELGKISGVTVESVEIGTARVVLDEAQVQEVLLGNAVEEAGFTLTGKHSL